MTSSSQRTTAPDFRSKKSAATLVKALTKDEHAPISAMIEVADRCNETCVHCYQIQGQKGELPTDDWRAILDELASMGVIFLTISGGEATLRKDFLDLVAHARKKRFAVKLYTNGLTMTEALANRLGELAVQEVQISLYSHRPEVHDSVTCVPGSFEKTVAGARYLVAAGVKTVLKSPLMTINQGEVDAYAAFVTSLGCDYMMDPHLDPREDGDRSPEDLRISDEGLVEALRSPLLRRGAPEPPPKRSLDASLCGACSGSVHIEANGEMRPCTQLPIAVGNAKEGVQKAWREHEDGRAIRSVTWRDLPACRQCDLMDYCARCFANARTEVDDALAPYPTACHQATLAYEVLQGERPELRTGEGREGVRTGPYRRIEGERHAFESAVATITEEDRARARMHGWARPTSDLVQLRRRSVTPS